ncbi:Crp/Fnr family transcriptional regulator [Variovorax sp. Root318D1]|uniref:Crp/Fnr family transcriptional regulator n=1 Tax=Variovorax sp. Root318D1 TaxID=1736513 RepID=UPI0006F974DD|nr:Crp/Fnr family transcriptional regulator [Variovorax sp. Root318D1]KQU89662.1 Crp/Fnr family transcriptional regulator [Variovorax sp. Root318D1]
MPAEQACPRRPGAKLSLHDQEREALAADPWFSTLSASLRHDILRRAQVRHYPDASVICRRGDPADAWLAVLVGAVRIGSHTPNDRQITLRYVEPGVWFGEVEMFDMKGRPYDFLAHGDTTLLCVGREDVQQILADHPEFCVALLRLQSQRARQLYRLVEDLNTKTLRARIARHLSQLARTYGAPAHKGDPEVRIGLRLRQTELADLIGCSRQRLNQELKLMERDQTIRVEPGGVVVRNDQALRRIYEHAS